MKTLAMAIPALLLVNPALAFDTKLLGQGGSLFLDDLTKLIDKAPKLKAEVDQALQQTKKTADHVICTGFRFSGEWKELGGYRAAPYTCMFADNKFLNIAADVKVNDKRGHAFDKPSKEAMKQAVKFTESNPRWTWTEKDPTGVLGDR